MEDGVVEVGQGGVEGGDVHVLLPGLVVVDLNEAGVYEVEPTQLPGHPGALPEGPGAGDQLGQAEAGAEEEGEEPHPGAGEMDWGSTNGGSTTCLSPLSVLSRTGVIRPMTIVESLYKRVWTM